MVDEDPFAAGGAERIGLAAFALVPCRDPRVAYVRHGVDCRGELGQSMQGLCSYVIEGGVIDSLSA